MSTVIYGLIAVGFMIGAVLAMLAFTKPGSFLDSILKPVSDRLKIKFERDVIEEGLKLSKAHQDLNIAKQKAYASSIRAEEARLKYEISLSPEHKKNIMLKKLRALVEENARIQTRIDKLKKGQGDAQ